MKKSQIIQLIKDHNIGCETRRKALINAFIDSDLSPLSFFKQRQFEIQPHLFPNTTISDKIFGDMPIHQPTMIGVEFEGVLSAKPLTNSWHAWCNTLKRITNDTPTDSMLNLAEIRTKPYLLSEIDLLLLEFEYKLNLYNRIAKYNHISINWEELSGSYTNTYSYDKSNKKVNRLLTKNGDTVLYFLEPHFRGGGLHITLSNIPYKHIHSIVTKTYQQCRLYCPKYKSKYRQNLFRYPVVHNDVCLEITGLCMSHTNYQYTLLKILNQIKEIVEKYKP